MEKFLFRKVELWVVLLLVVIGLVAMLLFGMAVADLIKGKNRFGAAAPAVEQVVGAHSTLAALVKEIRDPTRATRAVRQTHSDSAGFDFAYDPGTRPEAPYVLVNRYDADRRMSVSELVDLNTQETITQWDLDVTRYWRDSPFQSKVSDLMRDEQTYRFRGLHADVNGAGDLLVHGSATPLLKFDMCGELVWQQPDMAFHHSIERDGDGNYWVPSHIEPKSVPIGGDAFLDDSIVQISPDGEILFEKSVVELMDENGLTHLIYGHGFSQEDPIHINDIQPVMTEGALWQPGDLLLSIRNRSLVLLYRPETNEVLWHHAGYGAWLHQHDVNVIDARRISVFDNNARLMGSDQRGCSGFETIDPCMQVDGVNRMVVFDVTTGDFAPIFEEHIEAANVATSKQGRGRILDDGGVFMEETNLGRMLAFNPDGEIAWSYVNRAEADGRVYQLNWSRIVPRETGDAVREKLVDGACNG